MIKVEVLESLPKNEIYLIPDTLRCPDCQVVIGNTIQTLLRVQDGRLLGCPYCIHKFTIQSFAKQFAVIKNIKE